jgi:hypothetical protein
MDLDGVNMRSSLFALLALPLLYSCGGTEAADNFTVMDSAGITLVTNQSNLVSAVPQWSLVEDLDLTAGLHMADSPAFFRVAAVLSLPEDRVAVLDGGNREVMILSETGDLLEQFGREGDGPGEFRNPNSLVLVSPDSVGVYDTSHHRLSVFDRDGKLGRVITIEDVPNTSGFEKIFPLRGGDFVLFTWGGFGTGQQQGVFRAEAECLRISAAGWKAGSYGLFPGSEVFIGNGSMGSPFFSANTHVATSGDRLIVGTAEETEWRAYGADGGLSTIVRWPDQERVISQQRVDALIEAIASRLPEDQRTQAASLFSQFPWSPRAPAYQDVLASDEGEVWVGDYPDPTPAYLELPPSARRWLVFQLSGELKATLETPEGFRPLALGRGSVIGVFTDELGVQTLKKYLVVR